MKYTVAYTPFAEYQLCDIWLRALNRPQVTAASRQIERRLAREGHHAGRLRADNRWAIIVTPLGYTFEVSDDDRVVTIVSVRYVPPDARGT